MVESPVCETRRHSEPIPAQRAGIGSLSRFMTPSLQTCLFPPVAAIVDQDQPKWLSMNHLRAKSRFFAVFGGINSGSQLSAMALLQIPKGLYHAAQRWPDSERAYAGLTQGKVPTLKGLHINALWKGCNPFRVGDFSVLLPG